MLASRHVHQYDESSAHLYNGRSVAYMLYMASADAADLFITPTVKRGSYAFTGKQLIWHQCYLRHAYETTVPETESLVLRMLIN